MRLKLIGVILNDGQFTESTLDSFTDKKHGGEKIPFWYKEEEWDKITDYVRMEANAFIAFWQELKTQLPQLFPR